MSSFSVKQTEYFETHDMTGRTSYTKEQKEEIKRDFLDKIKDNLYFSPKEKETKIRENLRDSIQITQLTQDDIKILEQCLVNAVSYIGYTDGNFKYTKYLLLTDGTQDVGGTILKGAFYMKVPAMKEMGKIMSALSEEIASYGEKTDIQSNIQKMMLRNRYRLKDRKQKKFLFGKGHMVAGSNKVVVRRDLDMLFDMMNKSKEAVKNGDLKAQDFTLEVGSLKFFKFEKME